MSAASLSPLTLRTDLNGGTYPVRQCLGKVLGETQLIPVNPLLDMIVSFLIPSLYTRLTHDEVITTTLVPMPEGAAELRVNRGGHVFFTLTRANGEMHLLLMEIAEKVTTRVLRPVGVHPNFIPNHLFYGYHILKRDNQIYVAAKDCVTSWTIEADDTLSLTDTTPINRSNHYAPHDFTFFDYDKRYDSLIVARNDGFVQSIGLRGFTCKTPFEGIGAVFILSLTEGNKPTLIISANKGVCEWSESTGSKPLIETPCWDYSRTDDRVVFMPKQATALHTIDLTPAGEAPYRQCYTDTIPIRNFVSTTTCLWTLFGREIENSQIEMRLHEREIPLLANFTASRPLRNLFGSHDTLVLRTHDGECHVVNFKKPKPSAASPD